jgi:hypothetical protein
MSDYDDLRPLEIRIETGDTRIAFRMPDWRPTPERPATWYVVGWSESASTIRWSLTDEQVADWTPWPSSASVAPQPREDR